MPWRSHPVTPQQLLAFFAGIALLLLIAPVLGAAEKRAGCRHGDRIAAA